jgi:hypothetical protein
MFSLHQIANVQMMSKMAISDRDNENAPELTDSFLDEFDGKDSVGRLFAGCVVYLDEPEPSSERSPPYDRYLLLERGLILSVISVWLKCI